MTSVKTADVKSDLLWPVNYFPNRQCFIMIMLRRIGGPRAEGQQLEQGGEVVPVWLGFVAIGQHADTTADTSIPRPAEQGTCASSSSSPWSHRRWTHSCTWSTEQRWVTNHGAGDLLQLVVARTQFRM